MSGQAAGSKGEKRAGRLDRLETRNVELARLLQIIEDARAQLADQYDYAPLGSVTLDAQGCISEINLTAARMLGRERSRLLTMPFFTHVTKASLPAFFQHLRECRSRPAEVIGEVTLRARDRTPVPVELRSVPVLDGRGTTVYRTAITDITQQLRAGRALRESEARYRELIALSPDGIFVAQNGAIVFANGAALRFCGVTEARALVGRELLEWVRPSFRLAVSAVLSGAARETPPLEAQLAGGGDGVVEVEMLVRPFRHEGESAVLVVARDISRRRQAERRVLAISERERTRFGQDVHDSLCQSLMGAGFLTDVLHNRLRDLSPEAAAEAKEIGRIVRECGEQARTLARGLCPVHMEGAGLVAALHGLTADVTGRMKIGCKLECDDHLTLKDAAVATNVFRIAQEAVANAVKHGRAKNVLIQLGADRNQMNLRVRDDGKGIAAKPKQSGMGLQTMQYRATMIGGSLDVRRDAPRGTVVTCTFPANGAAP